MASGTSYTGDLSDGARINIADVAEALVPEVALFDPADRDGSMIYAEGNDSQRMLHVSYDVSGAEESATIMALRGGISLGVIPPAHDGVVRHIHPPVP